MEFLNDVEEINDKTKKTVNKRKKRNNKTNVNLNEEEDKSQENKECYINDNHLENNLGNEIDINVSNKRRNFLNNNIGNELMKENDEDLKRVKQG